MTKYLYYGPFPWEQDGGAVVNYYLLRELNIQRPQDEYYGVPKVPEELDGSYLPWINFFNVTDVKREIAGLMLQYEVPVVNIFHIGRDHIDHIIDPVHNVGGKIVLHQTIHWPDDDIFKLRRLYDMDKIVAPTNFAKRTFQRIAKIPPENITVIPHGVNTLRYRQRKTILEQKFNIDKSKQKVILYSGRLSRWKGVAEIIPIVRPLVKEYNCVFIIRGSSFPVLKESEKFAEIFQQMAGNNPNLIFLPHWEPPSIIEEIYALSDILIFNSAHEGFGCPLTEIQAVRGVPVTTALPNHVEICGRTGEVGMLLDPTVRVGEVNDGRELAVASADQVYGAIKWLLESPDELKAMGKRGRKNVMDRFDIRLVARQWLKMYDELIDNETMDDVTKKAILYEDEEINV